MSTDLFTYLNYMSTWDNESDENIDAVLKEHSLFVALGDFDSDDAVNSEFDTLLDLARDVRDLTVASDVTQIEADAAAVASIWSFGLGMAAFAALEAEVVIEKKLISSKSEDLNNKLTTADTDIAAKINPNVLNYVSAYKENNNLIASKAAAGLDTQTCRANLMQFMAEVEKNTTLTTDTFRQYASSARMVFDSTEINDVYDALDKLNMSSKSDQDITAFMNTLQGFTFHDKLAVDIVHGFSILYMGYKLKIANEQIESCAKEAGIPVEEVDTTAFEEMDACGKFVTAVAVAMSVVDVVFNILDIVDVVKQCKTMCDKLENEIKPSYLQYFNGMKEASTAYNNAIKSGSTKDKSTEDKSCEQPAQSQ